MLGAWKTGLIDQDVDDDLTAEIDLGADFEEVLVLMPAITSSTITIHVSNVSGGTFYPMHQLDADATGSYASATTAGTAAKAVIFPCGAQYIKISAGSSQAADRTFYVRGLSRK
jgi:hypothetical protein